MRRFILLVLACSLSISAYAWWDDQIPEKKPGAAFVFAENCNVRETASPKGKVLFQLQPGDPVAILEKSEISTRIGEKTEYWYRIKTATGTGFLWGGLIADGHAALAKRTVLVRNNGTLTRSLDVRILDGKKTIAKATIETGPVNSAEGHAMKLLSTSGLDNPPEMLFSLNYFMYSEIEGGAGMVRLLALKGGTITDTASWCPASCDPPGCGETFVLLPGETLPADAKTKRKAYRGEKNHLIQVYYHSDLDDPSVHEYSVQKFRWNGSVFELVAD
jgi:hypothetical protein